MEHGSSSLSSYIIIDIDRVTGSNMDGYSG